MEKEKFLDFQFKKEVELLPLFLNRSFRAMAVSLLSLFSSVYIYKTIFSLTNQKNIALAAVFIYFLGFYSCKFISNLFAEELSLRLGLKKQIYFGLLFLVFSLLILVLSLRWPLLLFFASPFWGLSAGFYWFGCHGLMVKTGREQAFGKELGMIGFINTLFLLGVPFLGGVLIDLAGYQALFGKIKILTARVNFADRPMKGEKTHYDTSLAEVVSLFKTHKRTFLAYAGSSVAGTIYSMVIPLYLFLILKKELSLGEFFSFSMILVALINLIVGRWVDIKGKRGMIAFGSVFQFFVWFGRGLTKGIKALFIFDIIDRITGGMIGIPLGVLSYQKALDGQATGRAVLFREIAITIGAIFSCLLLLLMVFLGIEFKFSFWVAALFSLLPLLIVRKR